ncbi:MAG: isoprenylcysteine carboxylmethyltransferase family protein [Betaproteobacteria bacterium]|nr:isoprenylcysteine carboxylmethyltransferase family protein [Betaproteobacteria bacterium]
MTRVSRIATLATLTVAQALGGASLLLFGVFLVIGPFELVYLGLSAPAALFFDGFLCLAFCVQHSVMVRQSFRRRLEALVPDHVHGAVYALASGGVLMALMILWQSVMPPLAALEGTARWVLRAPALAAILGIIWGVRALRSFDPFGVRPVIARIRHRELKELPLAVRGPYRWIRHPLYTCILLLLWCYPDLSGDRLLLNLMLTIWVVLGSVLEERDLVSRFGDQYMKYQREVPMLIPWRIPRA